MTALDARGVEITVGAPCIYGAPVGRSIALVEGVIDGFTDSGRVWVRVVRRAYGGGYLGARDRVHVGANRLVIVTGLPEATTATEDDKRAKGAERLAAYYREHPLP